MARFDRPESRPRRPAPAPPPPPKPEVARDVGLAVAHVAIGVVLGAVATISGSLLSRADGRDFERAFLWLAPRAEVALVAPEPAPPSRAREPQALASPAMQLATPPPPSFIGAFLGDPLVSPATPVVPTLRPARLPGVPFTTLRAGSPPTVESPDTDLALARHGARIVSASRGWGGGARSNELIDGVRTYDDWAHGHAFTGGRSGWEGETCGERSVEIELAAPARIDHLIAWHHGREHVPAHASTRIEALDGDTWRVLERRSTTAVHANETEGWWTGWSTPVEHRFDPVTTRRVRYVLDNCEIEHGWLYELEIYAATDAPS